MFLVLQALSHLETTLRTAQIVLKALSLQQVPQDAQRAKLELRQMKAEVLVLLAKLELLQGPAPSNAKRALLVKSQTNRTMVATSARVKPTHLKEMSLAGSVSFQL